MNTFIYIFRLLIEKGFTPLSINVNFLLECHINGYGELSKILDRHDPIKYENINLQADTSIGNVHNNYVADMYLSGQHVDESFP